MSSPNRRRFLFQSAASLGVLAAGASMGFDPLDEVVGDPPPPPARAPDDQPLGQRPDYNGPNVILVRFGGGVRRLETVVDIDHTFCPFIYHELGKNQGIIFDNVEIASNPGIDTSHGQGTLYLLTGQYRHYEDVAHQFLADRFEAQSPTLFEYLRRAYNIPAHQALIVNGEDRINEEFYTFSNHHLFGVRYRSTVLSLYRFKTFLLRDQLAHGRNLSEHDRRRMELQLRSMENRDYRVQNRNATSVSGPELDAFWRRWRNYYGSDGMVNPRGDRLLTTLSLWALRELKPRLMMINFQDPDYVHWGIANHYTRAISIIDEGVREIYNAVQADEFYRDRTVFVIVPDCGRDNNRCMAVPYQHHFNTTSAHQIFAVIAGPRTWVPRPTRVNHSLQQQISVTRTIGDVMGFQATDAEAPSLYQRA
jgi:hypothetical protein